MGAAEQGWEWEIKYLYSSSKSFRIYKVIYAALQTGSGLRRSREAGFCQPARCNEAAMFSSCFLGSGALLAAHPHTVFRLILPSLITKSHCCGVGKRSRPCCLLGCVDICLSQHNQNQRVRQGKGCNVENAEGLGLKYIHGKS